MNITNDSRFIKQGNVDEWNSEISTRLIPVSVILMMYLVVGVLGNSVTLYIYAFRFKGKLTDRFFIPSIAFFDLMTCVIGTVSSFIVNMFPVKFKSGIACKMMHFFTIVFSVASAFVLLAISVNRYLKICKPFKKQLTAYTKKAILVLIACSSALLTWPCFLFYGIMEVTDDRTNTLGYICTIISESRSSLQPLVFKSVMSIMAVFILLCLVTLYVLIGKTVFKQQRYRESTAAGLIALSSTRTARSKCISPNSDSIRGTTPRTLLETNVSEYLSSPETKCSSNGVAKATSSSETQCEPIYATVKTTTNRATSQLSEIQLALIFMLITVVFVICYVSQVIMLVYESQHEKLWIDLDSDGLAGYRFLYTLVYANTIVNPIIYGFFDRRFRGEISAILHICFKKRTS
ncbi:cholecystokinin receptor type A-like [Pecten maximus]|uniref:cholecystokinin receptor type A-like n=1 Tax=Pecten maximus TaxID=6579 RepID=UPI0014588DC0|nr:cholecystokinin receptor type A-like [Pecten maximus]